MANAYFYSNTAVQTTLTGTINNSTTTIPVAATTGFPVSYPYVLALDYGGTTEELVLVTNAAGLNLTVTRGFGNTSAQGHTLGAVVRHVYNAVDATDYRTHEATGTAVHGVTGAVVGTTDTQTLTNKTLTSPTINGGTITGTISGAPTFQGTTFGLTVKPTGTTDNGLIIQGVASQSADLLDVKDSSSNLLHAVGATGATTIAPTSTSVVPLTVNAPTSVTSDLMDLKVNGTALAKFTSAGLLNITPTSNAANTQLLVNAASGFASTLADLQVNGTSKFNVNSAGFATMIGGWQAGSTGQTSVNSGGDITFGGTSVLGTASMNNYAGIGGMSLRYKPTDTVRNNTASRTNDPDLTWTVSALNHYMLDMYLVFDADSAADIAFSWSFPTGATMVWSNFAQILSTASTAGTIYTGAVDQTTALATGCVGVGTALAAHVMAKVTIASTGGTLVLQWAQSVAQANNCTLHAGSWGRLTRIG